MGKSLVIVESPTKAKTIEKFLGKDFEVLASYGHVRDLPNSAAEIPAAVKKEKWSRLGIDVDNRFTPLYVIPSEKKKRVQEIKAALKNADQLLLATDEDREGESISWHLQEVLKPKVPVKRLVFHEITKDAIRKAVESPRDIDENLVKAQETRRVLDRLYGYSVSPLLWKKMLPRLSAGRVQSVALRLLVERERQRISFHRAQYWDLKALFAKLSQGETFEAELTEVDGKRVAAGKDFDPNTGKLLKPSDVILLSEATSAALRAKLIAQQGEVLSIEEKPYVNRPYAPFTTSTLQQEASRKLSYAARKTMTTAQILYENGFITYMRTDSTTLSEEALRAARSLIAEEFGKEYLFPEPRIYKTQVKNAQEAHEAIRPAGATFAAPATVRDKLGQDAFRLYELIWKRTIASQMKDAFGKRVIVEIGCENTKFRASGKTIEFAGFLRAYVEGADDPESEIADQERVLPPLTKGERLKFEKLDNLSHETQPPARYTEGSLIKELEKLGIGRPSTWATIVDVVLSRTYAFKRANALVPTFLAMAVTRLMEENFSKLLDYEFTARLEDDLDAISRGEHDSYGYLHKFYRGNGHPGLITLVEKGEQEIDPRIVCGLPLGVDEQSRTVEVRIGRYGPFVSNGEQRSSLPDGLAPDELTVERANELLAQAAKGPEALGTHPETGAPVYLKVGRFGPYVQMGDMVEGGEKPKMASLLPGMKPDTLDFETAIKILALPKVLGVFPDNNAEIVAANGRFGPYIKAGTETRSLPPDMSPISVSLEQAIALLRTPKTRGRRAQAQSLRDLGKLPGTETTVSVKSGRYGPYVTDGTVNASIPRGGNPDTITLEEAMSLLVARAKQIEENGGVPTKKRKAKSAPKGDKTSTKKPKASKKKAPRADEASA